ncbi:uncharacterized protein LOC141618020 [Silene latifolia]|uniref:uncharacterized protein LOC141618020 n=1 Tax=Silene latifolia TaxID=37657 RepID=UPI003D78470D
MERSIRKSHFRYFNMWGQAFDFSEIVKSEWENTIKGCKMFQVTSKLKCLKKPLKMLNRAKFSDIRKAADLARLLLDNIQTKLHQNPLDLSLMEAEKSAAQNYATLHKAQMSFLRQKAKVEWLKEGDENTGFFHRYIKARHMHNKVLRITDLHGNNHTDPVLIENSFLEYYQELLGSSKITTPVHVPTVRKGNLVTDAHVTILLKPVTDDEIKNCVFSIPSTKAPGPDGYSSQFFKDAWPIIGADICAAIQDFFMTGSLNPSNKDLVFNLRLRLAVNLRQDHCWGKTNVELNTNHPKNSPDVVALVKEVHMSLISHSTYQAHSILTNAQLKKFILQTHGFSGN